MIETERLILRPWQESDADALYKYASDSRVSELALWPTHTSVEMSQWVIREIFIPNIYSFAMVLKSTGEAIGCIGLVPEGMENYAPEACEREVGYWIGHPYWNQGLTSEALMGFMAYCRDSLSLSSLLITTDSRNIASGCVAQKCGFSLIDSFTHDNIPSLAYRIHL